MMQFIIDDSLLFYIVQFFASLSSFLLIYFAWRSYEEFALIPTFITILLALCSLVFLVSSTINWKTMGKINMARINFVSIYSIPQSNKINFFKNVNYINEMRKRVKEVCINLACSRLFYTLYYNIWFVIIEIEKKKKYCDEMPLKMNILTNLFSSEFVYYCEKLFLHFSCIFELSFI